MLTEKEQATLERLEQERERRRNEKIESGAAVRVLLPIVAGTSASVDAESARKRKLEELRRNGEAREVFFEEITIITGVPRPGREPDNYTPPDVPEAFYPFQSIGVNRKRRRSISSRSFSAYCFTPSPAKR